MKKNNAFTLLEVLVALTILSVSLLAIFNTQTTSLKLFGVSDNMTKAAYLAGMKMSELTLTYKGEFFGEIPENETGDFKDIGYESFKWEATFVSDPFLEKLGSAFAPKEGEKDSGLSQMASMVGINPKVIGETLSKSIKKLVLKISWDTGFDKGELDVFEHYIDKDPNLQCLPGLPDGSGGSAPTGGAGQQTGGPDQQQPPQIPMPVPRPT